MVCDFIWRADLEGVKDPKNGTYTIELNTPEYAGRVRDEKMVEKQLALGGMRLAAVLNEWERGGKGDVRGHAEAVLMLFLCNFGTELLFRVECLAEQDPPIPQTPVAGLLFTTENICSVKPHEAAGSTLTVW
ncbi:hypothetical protein FRC08_005713 [Ceratobasidium sp. 394]|nr:hypothetical protein FRC08_005713 [Ceratobasidium sp. 394]KAG9096816.1 hypothetical protein FS749_007659 [Ceratobasidium sp. UAMH 11750]